MKLCRYPLSLQTIVYETIAIDLKPPVNTVNKSVCVLLHAIDYKYISKITLPVSNFNRYKKSFLVYSLYGYII